MTFKEYRDKISIGTMAEHLGYTKDPAGGVKYRCYYLGSYSSPTDEIVIYNPDIPSKCTYFSRKGGVEDKGNLVNFILNRLDLFPARTKSGLLAVNEVLDNYWNGAKATQALPQVKDKAIEQKFNLNYWAPQPLAAGNQYLINLRRLSNATVEDFRRNLHIYTVGRSNHVAFPFRRPGRMEITNFELRNYFEANNVNYKGFCTGGDKSHSCWIANFVPYDSVTDIYLFESAIDAMSFYEINNYPNNTTSAFVSIGGHVTQEQIESIKKAFPHVQWHCCYDNDASGKTFDIATAYYLQGKNCKVYTKPGEGYEKIIHINVDDKEMSFENQKFSSAYYLRENGIDSADVIKPPKYKDWNELIVYYKRFDSAASPYAKMLSAYRECVSQLNLRGYIQLTSALEDNKQRILEELLQTGTSFISAATIAENYVYSLSLDCKIVLDVNHLTLVPTNLKITDKSNSHVLSAYPMVDFFLKEKIDFLHYLNSDDLNKLLTTGTCQYKMNSETKIIERVINQSGFGVKSKENSSLNQDSCSELLH
jgi:hypothetical protein